MLIDRARRQQAPAADLVGRIERDRRRGAVETSATDRAAQHQMVRAPAMVRPVAVRGQRATEIGGGEGGHLVRDTQLHGRAIKSVEREIELTHKPRMIDHLRVVGVVAAHRDHEDLPPHPQRAACRDDARDHAELAGE